jgi:hypothetical protein
MSARSPGAGAVSKAIMRNTLAAARCAGGMMEGALKRSSVTWKAPPATLTLSSPTRDYLLVEARTTIG